MILPSLAVPVFLSVILLSFPSSCIPSNNSSLPDTLDVSLPLGINCRGSALCPFSEQPWPPDYMDTLIEIANGSGPPCPLEFSCGPLKDTDIYLPNDHIMCLPLGESFLGGICAFTQGKNVPATGVIGALIKRKLGELHGHGCCVCGSVPLGGGNDPRSQGILTVNYVDGKVCKGLCSPKHYTAIFQIATNESRLLTTSDSLLES